MPIQITEEKLLLVEGQDEQNFFGALLRHMKVAHVQITAVGGKNRFADRFPAVLNDPGFGRVRRYAIVRDADRSRASAFRSVANLLRKHGQPCPLRPGSFASGQSITVGVYVVPGTSTTGMLEDLCLNTVADHPIMACVDRFVTCLDERSGQADPLHVASDGLYRPPRNKIKSRARAFLAGMLEDTRSVGVGAQQGCWNLGHAALNDLKAFLEAFR